MAKFILVLVAIAVLLQLQTGADKLTTSVDDVNKFLEESIATQTAWELRKSLQNISARNLQLLGIHFELEENVRRYLNKAIEGGWRGGVNNSHN